MGANHYKIVFVAGFSVIDDPAADTIAEGTAKQHIGRPMFTIEHSLKCHGRSKRVRCRFHQKTELLRLVKQSSTQNAGCVTGRKNILVVFMTKIWVKFIQALLIYIRRCLVDIYLSKR